MKIIYVDITNFRGISKGRVYLNGHSVMIGDNNAGKSTIIEAIDLVLGPDRLSRTPVVDEHDFFNGNYYVPEAEAHQCPEIQIEVLITDLAEDQQRKFGNAIEWWDLSKKELLLEGAIADVDRASVKAALRVKFVGHYNPVEDDFEGDTFFSSSGDGETLERFKRSDKRECGFLYLRALRTGSRALSMERGSLLDIILRIRDIRPKMWEDVLSDLRKTDVATGAESKVQDLLNEVQNALKKFVPNDWGTEPHLRVSDLTREHLRKTLTVFMATGSGYNAPFNHQGTGTINTMVLALLSIIAEEKKNVIFAMEEPEIAIPPYTQKRIVHSITSNSNQAIFTSHSPFVLEEFHPSQIILVQRDQHGEMSSKSVDLPKTIKPKTYNSEFRLRFAEALLAKRVLIAEGVTEASCFNAAARRLNELNPTKYSSLEAMGISTFDAMGDTSIPTYGEYFSTLGKTVFAVFDKQEPAALAKITAVIKNAYESPYKGFEKLIVSEMPIDLIKQFHKDLIEDGLWNPHLPRISETSSDDDVRTAILTYLSGKKGERSSADLIGYCRSDKDMPKSILEALTKIKAIIEPRPEPERATAEAATKE